MDINSLMNSDSGAARDRPPPAPAQAAQPHSSQQQHYHNPSPTLSRAPSDHLRAPSQYAQQPPPPHHDQRYAQQYSPRAEHMPRPPPPYQHPAQQPHGQPMRGPMQSPSAFERPPPPSLDTRTPHAYAHPQFSPRTPQVPHPGQSHSSAYPFPQQHPSPSQAPLSRPPERPHGSTPARTSSQSYGGPVPSPSPYQSQPPTLSASHSTSSATPTSVHAQSPHPGRDTSMTPLHGPAHGQATSYRSGPSTPLIGGHPQGIHTSRIESSPYGQGPQQPPQNRFDPPPFAHHRTLSNASATARPHIMSSSPVSRAGSHVEQHPGYAMPLHAKRPSAEQVHHIAERERSLSVSPKTQPPTRKSSTEQRPGVRDSWSASRRTSMSETHPAGYQSAHPQAAPPIQAILSPLSTSQTLQQSRRPSIPPTPSEAQHNFEVRAGLSRRPSEANNSHVANDLHQTYPANISREGSMILQQPISHQQDGMSQTKLKRRAESPTITQEVKKQRTQPVEPPAWARLHPSNPGYSRQREAFPQLGDKSNGPPERTAPPPPRQQSAVPPTPQVAQTNGHAAPTSDSETSKKARVAAILGTPWDLCAAESLPADRLLHQIAEFLYITILSNPNLGAGDAKNGTLEIEAKIGTLVDKNTEQRLDLPVLTPCALHEGFSKARLRFESSITENQFKTFNKTLNRWIQATRSAGRVQMDYAHRYEADSFTTFPSSQFSILPDSARARLDSHPPTNPLRLRTTHNIDPKLTSRPVLAQIIKLRLADLDVFCPQDAYDIRLSVNIEIDLLGRAELPDPAASRGGDRDRHKNRLSYKHVVSSIDLTQVSYEPGGQDKTHELEVEVDPVVLRAQATRLQEGRENAFEAVVEKFWSDVLMLVRVREEPADAAAAAAAAQSRG